MSHLLRRLALLPLLALTMLPACGGEDPPGATTGDDNEVVDIPNSTVKNQAIGNCWIYATTGWAESLRLGYSGEELNISESYLSYLDWFHGIQDGDFSEKDGIETGGWFGEAAEYLRRYGVMDEGTFIPEEANSEKSLRQKQALDAINASLKSGVLADANNRRDPNKVRDELDKAFKLSPEVIALLDEAFGHDLSRTIPKGATLPAGKGLRAPSTIEVGYYKPKVGGAQVISLADAIGAPSSEFGTYGWKTRKGNFAWNESSYPSTVSNRRTFQIRAQKAMHARRPVILVWFVDFNAMERPAGIFRNVPTSIGRQGGHMSVLEDYQVSNVPGFGTLEAGVVVTDPTALEAALSPSATIDFFRIKNSWGGGFEPPQGTDLKGYHDLYMAYLDGQIPTCDSKDASGNCTSPGSQRGLTSMVLPPATWDDVTVAPAPPEPKPEPANTCAHGLCSTGDKLVSGCDPCAQQICKVDPYCCNTAWDGICVKQVSSVCKSTCP
jgi:hypothetical protein